MRLGAQCDKCPLRGQVPVLGEGPLGAQLAIVGEAPGKDEYKAGHPFVGRAGEQLETYLGRNQLTRNSVFLTNAVLCFPPGGDYADFLRRAKKEWKTAHGAKVPFVDPVECCRPRLFNELRVNKCKRCGKWLGLAPEKVRCYCAEPLVIERRGIPVVVPMGNAAMESVLGYSGITKWRGSCLDGKKK